MKSIFDLKLKTDGRVVKDEKIKKIVTTLFNEKDQTNRLVTDLKGFYLKGKYLEFLKEDESFLNNASSMNLKAGIDLINNIEDRALFIKTMSLNPGDILPNENELEVISSIISEKSPELITQIENKKSQLKETLGMVTGDAHQVLKGIITHTYKVTNGHFPSLKIFLKELSVFGLKSSLKEEDLKTRLLITTPSEKKALEAFEKLKTKLLEGEVSYYIGQDLLSLFNLHESTRKKWGELVDQLSSHPIYEFNGTNISLRKKDSKIEKKVNPKNIFQQICNEGGFSKDFWELIDNNCADSKTLMFDNERRSVKLLFSDNYKEEFSRYLDILRKKGSRTYEGKTLLGNNRVCLTMGLEHDVGDVSFKEMFNFIKKQ